MLKLGRLHRMQIDRPNLSICQRVGLGIVVWTRARVAKLKDFSPGQGPDVYFNGVKVRDGLNRN